MNFPAPLLRSLHLRAPRRTAGSFAPWQPLTPAVGWVNPLRRCDPHSDSNSERR